MMIHGFDMHRVFISGPGDLERERDVVRAAIADANSEEAMPHQILLVSVGLREDDQIVGHRAAVSENVRDSEYFIQLFDDDWGPKNLFRKLFFLAAECRADPGMPMREVVVFLKEGAPEADPEIVSFRKELEDAPEIRLNRFKTIEQLTAQVRDVCSEWVRELLAETAAAG